MKKLLAKISIVALLLSFTSCRSPIDRVFNEETLHDDLAAIVAHSLAFREDMENLAHYLFFLEMMDETPEGRTYRELIRAANEHALERSRDEASFFEKMFNEETMYEDLENIFVIGAISSEEMVNLSMYFIHAHITGISFEGKTYGEIIDAANAFAQLQGNMLY